MQASIFQHTQSGMKAIAGYRLDYGERNKNETVGEWVIVDDPRPDSGFRRGASFNTSEVYEMERLGSFNAGTVLRYKSRRYMVLDNAYHLRKSRKQCHKLITERK